MEGCIFCKIIKKDVSADIVYENDKIIAFSDINALAPVHILIIPKEHIKSINDLKGIKGKEIAGELIMVAQQLAKNKRIADDGYKLLFRVNKHGQQEVPHIHLHLIGGAQLQENIKVE